jgi:hypothetical protein
MRDYGAGVDLFTCAFDWLEGVIEPVLIYPYKIVAVDVNSAFPMPSSDCSITATYLVVRLVFALI